MRICRSLLPVLLWLASAQAAVTNIRFLGSTPTQAVIAYTAPDSSACMIEVSESASYTPLVHDVDPALFSGANLDGRSGNLAGGPARTVVIGKRSSEMASDGRYYSRALQAYTPHYYRITCGSDVATGTFTTANLALGNNYPDPYPRDPNHPGRYAWPSIDYTYPTIRGNGTLRSSGANVTFAVPETISAGDYILLTSGQSAGAQRRVKTVTDSKHAVLYTGWYYTDETVPVTWGRRTPEKTSTQKIIDPFTGLLIRRISSPQQESGNAEGTYIAALTSVTPGTGWTNASTSSLAAVDSNVASYTGDANRNWLLVHTNQADPSGLYDESSQLDWITVVLQGSGNGSGNDNNIDLCLTADGATCRSAILTVNLSTCAPWWQVGSQCTVGTQVPVELAWQSSSDPIGSLVDPVEFSTSGGVLIRKSTTTSNTISLDYVALGLGLSVPGGSYTLGAQACSNALAAQTYNGVTRYGYKCIFTNVGSHGFWIDSTTGDSVLSAFYKDMYGYTFPGTSGAAFDENEASILYSLQTINSNRAVVKYAYSGNNLDVGFMPYQWATWDMYGNGQPAPTVLSSNVITDMAAFSPEFNAAKSYWAGNPGGYAVLAAGLADGRYLHVNFLPGLTQNALSFKGMYDVKLPGFVAGTSTVSYFPSRWCQMHDAGNGSNGLGWARNNSQGQYTINTCGNGSFQTELAQDLGAPGSGAGRDITCPAFGPMSVRRGYQGIGGSTGGINKCAAVLVTGDMYKPSTVCSYENTNRGAGGFLGSVQAARPGDILLIDSEHVQLLAKDSACSNPNAQCAWTVSRGVDGTAIASHSSRAAMTGICANTALVSAANVWQDVYWDFLHDPQGTDETMTYKKFLNNVHSTGLQNTNGTTSSLLTVQALFNTSCGTMIGNDMPFCYGVYSGTPDAIQGKNLAGSVTRAINMEPTFAGAAGEAVNADSHASLWQTSDYRWLLDGRPYYAPIWGQTWTNVTGKLYKSSFGATPLDQKHLPSEGFCWTKPAIDVTPGPIDAATSGAYTYCAGAGCYAGAASTDVFINCPDATTLACGLGGSEVGDNGEKDMCVHDLSPIGHDYTQVGITPVADRYGEYSRHFGTPFGRYRREDVYKNATASPDGKWMFFWAHWLDGMRSENMAMKLPPYPPKDSINRATFIPVPAPVGSVPAGTNNVMAEFGYDSTNFFCTSRRESCEAVTAAVNERTPFHWASETFAGFTGAPGAIVIPAISQRVLYYRLKYRDAGNAVIGTGPTQVQVVP